MCGYLVALVFLQNVYSVLFSTRVGLGFQPLERHSLVPVVVHDVCRDTWQAVEEWQHKHTERTDEGYARCGMQNCNKVFMFVADTRE